MMFAKMQACRSWRLPTAFVALDFETAELSRRSACALGAVRVDGDRISARLVRLIRPPRARMFFSSLHGIDGDRLETAPLFGEVWPEFAPLLDGVEAIAAHHAKFDLSVLRACCRAHGIRPPDLPYLCTVELAQSTWGLSRASLPVVCARLGFALEHHDPLSDAEACARIVMAARRDIPRLRISGAAGGGP